MDVRSSMVEVQWGGRIESVACIELKYQILLIIAWGCLKKSVSATTSFRWSTKYSRYQRYATLRCVWVVQVRIRNFVLCSNRALIFLQWSLMVNIFQQDINAVQKLVIIFCIMSITLASRKLESMNFSSRRIVPTVHISHRHWSFIETQPHLLQLRSFQHSSFLVSLLPVSVLMHHQLAL